MLAALLAAVVLASDAEEDLRRLVIGATAEGKRPAVYADLFGRRMRLVVESADEDGLKGRVLGQEVGLGWSELAGKDFLRLARDCASIEESSHVLLLLRFAVEKELSGAEGLLDRLRALDPRAAGMMQEVVRPQPKAPVREARRAPRVAEQAPRAGTPEQLRRGWECIGPGGGGYMYYPGVSPHDPELMFITCDMSGSYRSTDGGRSWRTFPVPEGTFGMMYMYPAFHPTDPGTIFWGNQAALLVSRDAGLSWAVAHQNGKRGKKRPPSAFAFDGDNPSVCFLAHGQRPTLVEAGSRTNELYRSRDGGRSWQRVGGFPGEGAVVGIHVDRTSPVARRRVFAAATRGVFASVDGGSAWQKSTNGLPSDTLCSFAGASDPKTKRVLLYTSFADGGVYVSADGALTWRRAGLPEGEDCRELAASNAAPQVAYVSTTSMNDGVRIYRTADAGATWSAVEGRKNPDDPGWKYLQGPRASGRINSLSVCPFDPSLIIVTDRSSAIVGERGGSYWRQVYCDPAGPGLWRGRGLEVTSVMDIVLDPRNPGRVYACYNDQGLMISPTAGQSWDTSMRGRMYDSGIVGYSCYAAALDPASPGVIYAGVSLPNDLDRRAGDDTSGFKGSLAQSTDNGRTWKALGRGGGLPQGPCTAVYIDPESPPSSRRIVAAIFGRGVYASEDGGKTWRGSGAGLGQNPNAFRLRRAADGTFYLCVLSGRGRPGGLFVSGNGGADWKRLGADKLSNVYDVAIAPRNPQVLYAACGKNSPGADGVYASLDGGRTWRIIFDHADTFSVCVHPRSPGGLYACSIAWASGGLWRSVDGGGSWKRIEDIPFRPIHRVVVDAVDDGRLWVATRGAGIWRGIPGR